MNAIGSTVCRELETDGVFYGVISAFHTVKGQEDLYTVEYKDIEDMDLEEYNYAYALWLKEEGWQVNEYQANVVDTTDASSKKQKQTPKKSGKDVAQPTKRKRKETAAALKIAKLQEVVDLTAKTTIAGKHISALDADEKMLLCLCLAKLLKKRK